MKLNPKAPFFLFLLPVFFVLHGFMENYNFVPVKDALLLIALYIGFSLVFMLASWLLFRNIIKAALVSFYIMVFHFFFGSVQDFLKKAFPGSILQKYTFIIGAAFLLLLVLVVLLKKRKQPLTRLTYYLNVLFLVLILVDLGFVFGKMTIASKPTSSLPAGMTACSGCERPDIYFIIADEYVSNTTLLEKFNFDNTAFTEAMAQRGFHLIPHSSSNYNYTPQSVASTLNMDYLDLKTNIKKSQPDLALCYATIQDNRLLQFLEFSGYNFYNCSIFNFRGKPSVLDLTFLPVKTKLITSQTFLSRVDRDIRYHLITRFKSESELKRLTYGTLHSTETNYNLTIQASQTNDRKPKFVFTHLHIPHYPYFFDHTGKPYPFEKLQEENQVNKEQYIEYLQYGNKKYLELIDQLLKNSKRPPVIILMGDHGFRHFTEEVPQKYLYQNYVSLLLPDKQYAGFTDSLTNVNFFRIFLNTQFRQQLPLLKDTTIFIVE